MREILDSKQQVPSKTLLVLVTLVASLIVVATFPANALSDFRTEFNPEITVSSSSHQAAANPEKLSVVLEKTKTHCESGICDPPIEQNFSELLLVLAPNLLASAGAAPYCDPIKEEVTESGLTTEVWTCTNESAVVGDVEVTLQLCHETIGCGQDPEPDIFAIWEGIVYNKRPDPSIPGEVGGLITLFERTEVQVESGDPSLLRIDTSITLEESPTIPGFVLRVNTVEIPDHFFSTDSSGLSVLTGIQIQKLKLDLNGRAGAEIGKPLITNPGYCQTDEISAEVQGYEFNTVGGFTTGEFEDLTPAFGIGERRSFTLPYETTGCDPASLGFTPKIDISLDNNQKNQPVGITATVSQPPNQGAISGVTIELPNFGINLDSTVVPCQGDVTSCSQAVMGQAVVSSPLLPVGEVLAGPVLLRENSNGLLKFSAELTGFIDLTIKGDIVIDASAGKLTAVIDELPAIPFSDFTMTLNGGNASLIKNSSDCGKQVSRATFTSYADNRSHVSESSNTITGCSDKTEFSVDLTENIAGKKTGIDFDLDLPAPEPGKTIKNVKFLLDRNLKVRTSALRKKKRSSKKSKKKSSFKVIKYGELRYTPKGEAGREGALKQRLSVKSGKSLKLTSTSLEGISANLFQKLSRRNKSKKLKRKSTRSCKSKRCKKRRSRSNKGKIVKPRFYVKGLENATNLSISLDPDEKGLFRTKKATKKSLKALRFVALITHTDGSKRAIKAKVKLKRR